MPRNGSGTYTLPTGNPVVTGTTIESNWANTTLSDVATEITGSLARSGSGGMTGALRLADGSQAVPSLAFGNETGTGLYRAGTGEMWATVQGAQTLNLDANGVYVPADKTTTVDGAFVFNEAGADKDARFEGDTDANLLFTDASTDRVGVGTNTPTAKLNVEGSVIINDAGADVDVRIEGDTDANLLFTDASTDRVGVGTNTPSNKLTVSGNADVTGDLGVGTTSPTFGNGTGVEIQRAGVATLRLENSSASNSFEMYVDTAVNGVNLRGRDSSPMLFWTGNTERARIHSTGGVSIGNTTDPGATNLSVTGNVTAASFNTGQLAGMRNKIINGDMTIAQRGTSFASIGNAQAGYFLDRWLWDVNGTGVATITQNSDVPSSNEFQYSFRVAVTTADTSIAATDNSYLLQRVEGFNARDLIGKTFTLSFWVRSSKTGTHCVSFRNSGGDRSYVAEYTINAANTWEQKSITVSGGLITAGTWNWTNGIGVALTFALAAGTNFQTTAGAWQTGNYLATANQVNCLDSNTNIFAITGVQLEVGAVATPFEHRPYGTELALCQRYYYRITPAASNERYSAAWVSTATTVDGVVQFPVTMRADPTALEQSGTATDYGMVVVGSTLTASAVPTLVQAGKTCSNIRFTYGTGGLTLGQGGSLRAATTTNGYLGWSAEL